SFGKFLADIEDQWDRPREAVRQPHVADDALIFLPIHETAERREGAVHQQLDIANLALSQTPRGIGNRPLALRFEGVAGCIKNRQLAAVRSDERTHSFLPQRTCSTKKGWDGEGPPWLPRLFQVRCIWRLWGNSFEKKKSPSFCRWEVRGGQT